MGFDLPTKAKSKDQGSMALVYRNSEFWQIESILRHGPNVISVELVTGNSRYSCITVYIPPVDVDTIAFIEGAFERLPGGPRLFLGDLTRHPSILDSPSIQLSLISDSTFIQLHRFQNVII
jgi:hypothetical protein